MAAAGLRGLAVPYFAISLAYDKRSAKQYSRQRWRNIAYATRYGKGCSLTEAMSLDLRGMADYIEAVAFCVDQEAKASKPKKRR